MVLVTLSMRLTKALADLLYVPPPPVVGGWRENLEGAFAALDKDGSVAVIGYDGEWFFPVKPSIRVRIHNRLVSAYNRQLEGV